MARTKPHFFNQRFYVIPDPDIVGRVAIIGPAGAEGVDIHAIDPFGRHHRVTPGARLGLGLDATAYMCADTPAPDVNPLPAEPAPRPARRIRVFG